MRPTMRFGLLPIALLTSLATVAGPAHATLTPVNGAVNASSFNITFAFAGLAIRCPGSTLAGSINGTGTAVSAEIDFHAADGRSTCATTLGTSTAVTCTSPTTFTLRVTSSATISALGTVALDSNFTCRIDTTLIRLTCSGPQTLGGSGDYTETTRRLRINVRPVCNDGSDNVTVTLTGDYNVPNNVTVS